MKRLLLPLGLILAFGALKAPLESHLLVQERASGFQAAQLNMQLRSQLGQMGFMAALSGFRAIMADLLWIRSGSAFERTEWGRMKLLLESATQLQPKAILFWEMAHFHMAYDAAISARENVTAQPSDALRRKAEREYHRIGEQFLLDGITHNPNSARLHERLGALYDKKFHDHARAAQAYTDCAQKPGAMGYIRRFAAYQLAQASGYEKEAYARLLELYQEGEQQRLPTLLNLLHSLAEKLAIPAAERVYTPPSTPPAQPTLAR